MRCRQIDVKPLFGKCKRLSKQKRRRLPACPNFLWQHPVQKGQNGLHGCAYGVILKEGGLSAMLKAAGRVFLEAARRLHHAIQAPKRCRNHFSLWVFSSWLNSIFFISLLRNIQSLPLRNFEYQSLGKRMPLALASALAGASDGVLMGYALTLVACPHSPSRARQTCRSACRKTKSRTFWPEAFARCHLHPGL